MISVQIGDMGAMLKGKVPFDAEQFKMRANNAAALSKMQWEAFYEGTDKGDTAALAAVWAEMQPLLKKRMLLQQMQIS